MIQEPAKDRKKSFTQHSKTQTVDDLSDRPSGPNLTSIGIHRFHAESPKEDMFPMTTVDKPSQTTSCPVNNSLEHYVQQKTRRVHYFGR